MSNELPDVITDSVGLNFIPCLVYNDPVGLTDQEIEQFQLYASENLGFPVVVEVPDSISVAYMGRCSISGEETKVIDIKLHGLEKCPNEVGAA